jgi:hypothetical protein
MSCESSANANDKFYSPAVGINLFRLLILFYMLAGCHANSTSSVQTSRQDATPTYQPVIIKSGIENGHPADIRIAIQRSKDADISTTFELLSSYENKPVGFLLTIPRETDGQKRLASAYIKSLGAPSDHFLHFLAAQYNQKIDSSAKMADSIPFVCMNLEHFFNAVDTPKPGDWIAAQYKLFFDSESEDGDAELFMNIAPGHWIEFAEKDDDYRSHLIGLFTRKGK